jgi:hypothetical protein
VSSQTQVTTAGIARVSILIEQSGVYEIQARSDPAVTSTVIRVDVPPEESPILTETEPPIQPTDTATLEPEPSLTPPLEATPTPPPPGSIDLNDWLLSSLVTIGLAATIYLVFTNLGSMRWGIRSALLAAIGGLIGYGYLSMSLPGSRDLLISSGTWGVVGITVLGAATGLAISLAWQKYQIASKKKGSAH